MGKQYDNTELARDYFEKGYLLQKSGHLDRAAHFYRRSIEFQPTAQAFTFLGWVYSQKGLLREAIEQCKAAIEIDPDYGNPYNDIGAYLLQMNNYFDAEEWFLKALQASKYENYCYPYMNLGKIYEFRGLWEKAGEMFNRALKENPSYTPASDALIRLSARYN